MAAGAAGAGQAGGGAAPGAGNPFQLATNLYAEKNNQGILTAFTTATGTQSVNGGNINAGQYLRRVNLIFRTSTAGTVATAAATSDLPWNILTNVDLVNVDGSEILYVMG